MFYTSDMHIEFVAQQCVTVNEVSAACMVCASIHLESCMCLATWHLH